MRHFIDRAGYLAAIDTAEAVFRTELAERRRDPSAMARLRRVF